MSKTYLILGTVLTLLAVFAIRGSGFAGKAVIYEQTARSIAMEALGLEDGSALRVWQVPVDVIKNVCPGLVDPFWGSGSKSDMSLWAVATPEQAGENETLYIHPMTGKISCRVRVYLEPGR